MADDRNTVLALADHCVKCAQCLPHCPTWRLTRDETESPRGRIALMQALAEGAEGDAAFTVHLDRCLGCGQCESACPAEVPYGRLAAAARAAFVPTNRHAPLRARILRAMVAFPRLLRTLFVPLLRLATWLPLRHSALPARAPAVPSCGTHTPVGPAVGDAWLFIGCIAAATDGAVLNAALASLLDAGYRVHVPPDQGCCGTMHHHAGDRDTADTLARRNHAAFDGDGPIATCASGCAATLRTDPVLGGRISDISTLLADRVEARPAAAGTVIHTPCTLHAVLDEADGPARLIDGAKALPTQGRCCGGAGEYMLRHPELAMRLREEVLDDIGDAAVVCTSNTGCALHLRDGLARRGSKARVSHPVLEWRRAQPDRQSDPRA